MNIKELTKEEFERFPIYKGKYLHISSLREEKVSYEGQTYLVMDTMATGKMWVSKDVVIAHMVGYYDISETSKSVDASEWKTSKGDVTIFKDWERAYSIKLPAGSQYRLARSVDYQQQSSSFGTLAVRYPDVKYPSI